MHGLQTLFILALIGFFVVWTVRSALKRAATALQTATSSSSPVVEAQSGVFPAGFGGVIGGLAGAAAVATLTAVVGGEADVDFDFGGAGVKRKIADAVREARLSGEPLDFAAIVSNVAASAPQERKEPPKPRPKKHAAKPTHAGHAAPPRPGDLLGVLPPLDARAPLGPLAPMKVLAPHAPANALAPYGAISA